MQIIPPQQLTPENFVNWLDGFLAANPEAQNLNETQTKLLKDKLNRDFNKVTPDLVSPQTIVDTLPQVGEIKWGGTMGNSLQNKPLFEC